MESIQFSLSGGLSERQIGVVHDAVLAVLDRTGLACAHERTVEVVAASDGIRFEDGRLKFAPDFVNATVERARAAGKKRPAPERLRVTAPWNCFNVIDMRTDEVRASTAADVVETLKLVASFTDGGPPPVYPCDLDARIQVLWLEKVCLELAPGFGGGVVTHDPDTMRWIGELYAAAGKHYDVGLQFAISPLRLDHLALDLYWRFKDDPLVGVQPSLCPMPVAGLTAPLFASGLLAQGIAESLGAMMVAQQLGSAGPDELLPLRVDYGDMRDLTVGYSLPENVMIQVLVRDLAEHFSGYLDDTIYINTNAKRPDGFAAVDRMGYILMLGLAGYRNFILGAGQMSMDEIFSPAQLIIDLEVGRYVQHILDGMPWYGDASTIAAAIADGVAEGNYLAHPTTLEALPRLFDSTLFRRSNVGQWRASGEPRLEEAALARAQEAVASYHHDVDPAVKSELDRVFAEACAALGVDVSSQPIPSSV